MNMTFSDEVNICRVLRAFFGHVNSAFRKLRLFSSSLQAQKHKKVNKRVCFAFMHPKPISEDVILATATHLRSTVATPLVLHHQICFNCQLYVAVI